MVDKQEAQTERAAVMLTPDEKNALKLVAAFDNATESDTLRSWVAAPLLERATKIRALREVA
jgi:hypothetical protein